jgi:hypothetical protein
MATKLNQDDILRQTIEMLPPRESVESTAQPLKCGPHSNEQTHQG